MRWRESTSLPASAWRLYEYRALLSVGIEPRLRRLIEERILSLEVLGR